jgi:nitroimidazol reductase NimA-like FMN-containing flavoprotein (pyridoxamine 5'-phosphate oxidase superfamily)
MDEMSEDEVQLMLAESEFGHVALASGGRAYAIPIFFAVRDDAIFFQSHPGLKESFMNDTDEACLVVSRVDSEDTWMSVQVFGPVSKVATDKERQAAEEALMNVALPPEWGSSGAGQPRRSDRRMFIWKLQPARFTGRRSAPAPPADDPGIE